MQIETLEDTLIHLLKIKEYELLCSEIQSQVLNIEMSSYFDMLLYITTVEVGGSFGILTLVLFHM